MIDLLLIYPPTIHSRYMFENRSDIDNFKFDVPCGALSIASFLEDKDYSARVIECDTPIYNLASKGQYDKINRALKNHIEKSVKNSNPRYVGLSTLFNPQIPITNKLLSWLKEKFPEIKTIAGGNAATYYQNELNLSKIDHLVKYEGEKACLSILHGNTQQIIKGENIDPKEIPAVNWGLTNFSEEINKYQFYSSVSRGCFGKCGFCNTNDFWKGIRFRDVRKVRKELSDLVTKGADGIMLGDDTLHPLQMYDGRGEHLLKDFKNVNFLAESRVDVILRTNKDQLKEAKRYGLNTFFIGAESGSDKVLRLMNKKISTSDIVASAKKLKNLGFDVYTFWIFGYPGSKPEEDKKTLHLIEEFYKKRLHDRIYPHIYRPIRGTSSYNDHSLEILEHDLEKWGFNGDHVQAIHNIINPSTGKVVYSGKQMERIFDESIKLKKRYQEQTQNKLEINKNNERR